MLKDFALLLGVGALCFYGVHLLIMEMIVRRVVTEVVDEMLFADDDDPGDGEEASDPPKVVWLERRA